MVPGFSIPHGAGNLQRETGAHSEPMKLDTPARAGIIVNANPILLVPGIGYE